MNKQELKQQREFEKYKHELFIKLETFKHKNHMEQFAYQRESEKLKHQLRLEAQRIQQAEYKKLEELKHHLKELSKNRS